MDNRILRFQVFYDTWDGSREDIDNDIDRLAEKYGLERVGGGYFFARDGNPGQRDLDYEPEEEKCQQQ